VSTVVEGKDAKSEIAPAIKLLDKVDQQFFWVTDQYVPVNDPSKDQCYITQSYDATTHFEQATTEVLELYFKLTGKPLDLTISAEPDDLDPANQAQDDVKSKPAETNVPTNAPAPTAVAVAPTAVAPAQNQPTPNPAAPGGPK